MESSSAWPLDDDRRMLRRFVAGDGAACREIERQARAILLYRRLGLGGDEREDVVQEVVADVWRAAARPGFELRHGLRAFVRTVTVARAIDRVRRRRPTVEVDAALADPAPGPALDAEAAAERERLHAALATLDARCREVIRLHFFEDWPYARIAAREGRSEATMRVRMFHCMRALRERLGAAGPSGGA